MSNLFRSGMSKLPKYKKFSFAPRYYDEEEEERRAAFGHGKVKMEKGAFYNQKNTSRLVGAFSEKEIAFRDRPSKSGQFIRIILLVGMMTICILGLLDQINIVTTVGGLLLLLVLFIFNVNKN